MHGLGAGLDVGVAAPFFVFALFSLRWPLGGLGHRVVVRSLLMVFDRFRYKLSTLFLT